MSLKQRAILNGAKYYLSILKEWEKAYLSNQKVKVDSEDYENILHFFGNLIDLHRDSSETNDRVCELINDFVDNATYISQLDFTYNQRITWFLSGVEVARISKWHDPLSRHLNNLGITYWKNAETEKAKECFEEAIHFAELGKNQIAEINALGNLGNLVLRSDPDAAINYFNKAMNKQTEDQENKICSLNNLGLAYRHKKEFKKALEFYHTALELLAQHPDVLTKARTLGNIGVIYALQKNFDKAENIFRELIKVGLEEAKDLQLVGRAYGNLGNVYMDQERFVDARKYIEEYLKYAKLSGDKQGEIIARRDLIICEQKE